MKNLFQMIFFDELKGMFVFYRRIFKLIYIEREELNLDIRKNRDVYQINRRGILKDKLMCESNQIKNRKSLKI